MSIRPHLIVMLDCLEREIRPDLTTSRSISATLALGRLLKRMIVYSSGPDEIDTPDYFFGGSAFRRQMNEEAATRINADTGEGFDWAQRMVVWETERYEEVSKRLKLVQSEDKPSTGEMGTIDRRQVQNYLQAHFHSPSLVITEFAALHGGHSKKTAKIDVSGSSQLPKKLILRMERASGIMPSSIAREFPILQLLHSHGISVPKPLLVERSSEPLGGAFLVMEALPGHSEIGNFLNPPKRPALGRQAARILGQIHALKGVQLSEVGGTLQHSDPNAIRGELETIEDSWVRFQGPWSVCGPFALKWLRRNLHLCSGETRLIHCDADFHNFLIDGDNITALLDWETAQIGNPAYDLGYIRWSAEQLIPWHEFVDEYQKAGGPVIPPEQVDFYALWGIMRLAGPLMTRARRMVEEGTTRNVEYSVIALEILQRCMHRMASDLARVRID